MAKVKLGKFEVDQADLNRQIAAATERGDEELRRQPLATRVRYDRRTKRLVLTLNNGAHLEIPVSRLQGLTKASDAELAKVRILGPGTAVEWTTLDQQFSVQGLLTGVFGSRIWMAKLGLQGGKPKSPAKPEAARKNGARGGRPRRQPAIGR